jgi:hypothetical protein
MGLSKIPYDTFGQTERPKGLLVLEYCLKPSGRLCDLSTNDRMSSERTAPLQSQFQSKTVLPYDNTGGSITGVAIANLSSTHATITATILDQHGFQLGC